MVAPRRPRRHSRTAGPSGREGAVERLEDRLLPTLLGQQLFPSDNPWNQDIADAPVAANSAAIINNIIALYGDNRLHPDFGQDTRGNNPLYGIPFNVVHGNSLPKVHVVIDAYPGESDLQDAPIPANAVIEGDEQNGPTVGLANRGDSHLLVWDEDNNVAYEFYQASRPSENGDGRWHAAQESVWDMKADTFRTIGFTSADAAGLPILPGLVRPDEGLPASQGGQGAIDHAIRFTLQNNIILDQFLYPASHVANPGNTDAADQPPMGARFRLKASVDISGLNPESRVIAQAMKDYGLIVADNGSNFFFSGASYSVDASNQFALTWDDNDIQDTAHGLKSLHFSDFEVVDTTPVVTGLAASTGPAGSTVTILGRNFSGAAGRLELFFGGAIASNVTVVDDSHVTATVPAGSGTVDVRVQSGVTTASDPSNSKDPIFGYGISATSASDRFTYGAGPVVPPPPAPVLEAGSDSGSSHSDGITDVTSPTFDVTATVTGATVELYRDGALVGSRAGSGPLTDAGPVPAGAHAYTAKQVDASNNRSAASTTTTVTVLTAPPPVVGLALNPADDSGASSSDRITNVVRPHFTISAAVAGDVYDLLDAGGAVLATATAAGGSLTLQPAAGLPQGSDALRVRATDVAGNTRIGASLSVTIDTTPPTAPGLVLSPADGTPTPGGGTSRSRRPHLVGSSEPGATVQLYDGAGDLLGTTIPGPGGAFTLQPAANLPLGPVVLLARATDVAGNRSPFGRTLDLTVAPSPRGATAAADFDGDGKTDFAIYDQGAARFFILLSGGGALTPQFGNPAHANVPVAGDFDGDGKADLSIYDQSASQYFILLSGGGARTPQFGNPAHVNIPIGGDFDGDGKADFAIYDQTRSQFLILLSGGGALTPQFGNPTHTNVPIAGDFNADSKADFAVYDQTASQFFILFNGAPGALTPQFGNPSHHNIPVAGDFDGDGKTDYAIYDQTASQFFILLSAGGARTPQFGNPAHANVPVAGDFDGDGRTDFAIYDQTASQFFILLSGGGALTPQFGNPSHHNLPIPASYGGPQARAADVAVSAAPLALATPPSTALEATGPAATAPLPVRGAAFHGRSLPAQASTASRGIVLQVAPADVTRKPRRRG
jgi:hypothetical protein